MYLYLPFSSNGSWLPSKITTIADFVLFLMSLVSTAVLLCLVICLAWATPMEYTITTLNSNSEPTSPESDDAGYHTGMID